MNLLVTEATGFDDLVIAAAMLAESRSVVAR
jgi:hypothetical protein